MPREQIVIGVHLVEHCNLKCKGCDNFSPLAAEEYVNVKQYANDLKRMSDLFGDNVERIDLYGGEPLLHPQIVDLLNIARENFHGYLLVGEKVLWKQRIDITGSQNAKEMFHCCGRANDCIILDKGKLYTCTMIPFVGHFNAFFHENIEVTEDDSIDIYQVKSAEEIFAFLSKPVPCCRYCDIYHNEYGLKWEQSRLDKSEWI